MKSLIEIQNELKAPKGQFNSFGKYKYRSCEDILEAVKPLLKKNNCHLTITDDLVMIGERYYVKATATLSDGKEEVTVSAFAREEESKKGMDGSQVTGASSSYARKYCLNGLFCIDDTKDSDATNTGEDSTEVKKTSKKPEPKPAEKNPTYREQVIALAKTMKIDLPTLSKMYNLNPKTTEQTFEMVLKEMKEAM